MSLDYAFSIAYWVIWGVLIIPIMSIVIRHWIYTKWRKDKYTIFTMIIFLLMLAIRVLSLIPIIKKHNGLNKHFSSWSRTVFTGTPILLFWYALLIHTMRWYDLQQRLIEDRPFSSRSFIKLIILILTSSLLFSPVYLLYCITGRDWQQVREIVNYLLFGIYVMAKLVLLIINWYLTYSFTSQVSRKFPILYQKMKYKFFILQGFVILLILTRLGAFILFIVAYERSDQYKITVESTILLWVTEVLPLFFIMLTFVVFRLNARDTQSLDTSLSPNFLTLNHSVISPDELYMTQKSQEDITKIPKNPKKNKLMKLDCTNHRHTELSVDSLESSGKVFFIAFPYNFIDWENFANASFNKKPNRKIRKSPW